MSIIEFPNERRTAECIILSPIMIGFHSGEDPALREDALPARFFRRLLIAGLLFWLYFVSRRNYLLFHSLTEFFSIIIAYGLFSMAWNTRRTIENRNFILLGIAYLSVAVLDFFHILGYEGMGVFTDYAYYGNQVWIAGRAVESASLAIFALNTHWDKEPRIDLAWISYSAATVILVLAVFTWKIFPVCFVDGFGQTPFKIGAEYFVVALLLFSLAVLLRDRKRYSRDVLILLAASILLTILSEFAFTLYSDNYGILNLLGHYLKVFSFWFVHKAVTVNGLSHPLSTLTLELTAKNRQLESAVEAQRRINSVIGHDIRNAIRGVRDLAALLRSGDTDAADAEYLLEHLESGSEKAADMLNTLLDWSRSRTGAIEPSKDVFAVGMVVEDVVKGLRASADAKGLSLIIDGDSSSLLTADQVMFHAVVRNLAGNAMKYTPEGGSVRIAWKRQEDKTILAVSDDGMGMSPARIAAVLAGTGVESLPGTGGERGSGLGLDIVRAFLALNGGELEIESSEGEGSVFRSVWPNEA